MTRYKMFTGANTTTDGLASIDIVADGEITSVTWVIRVDDAGVASGQYELSFASSSAFATNDSRNQISSCAWSVPVATEARAYNFQEFFDEPIKVSQGERIFLHHLSDAAADDIECTVYLHVSDKARGSRLRL